MLLSATSMRLLSCLSSPSREISWIALSLNTSTARAISPISSRSARQGTAAVVSCRASFAIAPVTSPSRDSTRCIEARPIGPIRMNATKAQTRTAMVSDFAENSMKATASSASCSRWSR